MVDIKGLSRAKILAALWNTSRSQGISAMFQSRQSPMTEQEAQAHLDERDYFDYLNGRVMKIQMYEGATDLDPRLYDRDNGQGAAEAVIAALRKEAA